MGHQKQHTSYSRYICVWTLDGGSKCSTHVSMNCYVVECELLVPFSYLFATYRPGVLPAMAQQIVIAVVLFQPPEPHRI